MADELLIEAGWIVTLDEDLGVIRDGALLIRNDRVLAIGKREKIAPDYSGPRFDARDRTLMPGLVNAHMHLYSTFARGMQLPGPAPASFIEILESLWWRLDKALTLDDLYFSAIPPLCESLRHGVTTIFDHHASPHAIAGSLDELARACGDVGLRGVLCYEVSDRDGPEIALAGIEENRRFLSQVDQAKDPTIGGLFGLHASFTLSDETLARCVEAAKPLRAGFHIHVAEAEDDPKDAIERDGSRTVERLHRARVLGPRCIAAHCVHISPEELALLARSRTGVVTNPQSNMNNAVGAPALLDLLAEKVAVGLGSDGMTGDVFQEARALSLLHRHIAADPRVGWDESMQVAFYGTSAIASRHTGAPVGVIKPGAYADLVIRRYQPPTPLNSDNAWGHFLFGLGTASVDEVWVGGRSVLSDGEVLGVDEAKLSGQAKERAAALWKRLEADA